MPPAPPMDNKDILLLGVQSFQVKFNANANFVAANEEEQLFLK